MESGDELFGKAVELVVTHNEASVLLLQQRLLIGHNRAARLMEDMEALGVVSSMNNRGVRDVLAKERTNA